MTASMIDEGTARRTGPELSAELERRGGSLSCHADWNAARLRLQLLSSDLEYGLELLAELLFEPAFPEHELERLRQQTLAELKRRADQPAALADEAFAHHLYAGTIFAHPLAGNPAALAALRRDELLAFHRERYRLDRGALVVAGDVDRPRLAAAIAAAFGAPPAATSGRQRSARPCPGRRPGCTGRQPAHRDRRPARRRTDRAAHRPSRRASPPSGPGRPGRS